MVMRESSNSERIKEPRELTFAWVRGDESLIRFWCALLLAAVLMAVAWFSLRIVVPVSVAADRPRVGQAQLILLNEESHPSLQRLLSSQNLPSLGGETLVGETPPLEDVLTQLGLGEERGSEVELYPAPAIGNRLQWPEEVDLALALPPLPEVSEDNWPTELAAETPEWSLQVSAQGALGELLDGHRFLWDGPVPVDRKSIWSLATDDGGELAFAVAVGEVEEEAETRIRGLWQRFFDQRGETPGRLSGLLAVTFVEKKDE